MSLTETTKITDQPSLFVFLYKILAEYDVADGVNVDQRNDIEKMILADMPRDSHKKIPTELCERLFQAVMANSAANQNRVHKKRLMAVISHLQNLGEDETISLGQLVLLIIHAAKLSEKFGRSGHHPRSSLVSEVAFTMKYGVEVHVRLTGHDTSSAYRGIVKSKDRLFSWM